MLQYFLDNLLPLGIAVSGAIAWVLDKRKRSAELQSVIAQNKNSEATALSGMQDVYDRFVEDVRSQLEELRNENIILKQRINELEIQLLSAEEQSKKDGRTISELKAKIESYERELKTFRKERE